MFKFILKIFFGLLSSIFNASEQSKIVFVSNQKYMTQSTLINLHAD